jgi:hypothetical protein
VSTRLGHKRRETYAFFQISRVRASLPKTIVAMLEQIQREAGLIGTVIFAGPDVEQGGNIYSLA